MASDSPRFRASVKRRRCDSKNVEANTQELLDDLKAMQEINRRTGNRLLFLQAENKTMRAQIRAHRAIIKDFMAAWKGIESDHREIVETLSAEIPLDSGSVSGAHAINDLVATAVDRMAHLRAENQRLLSEVTSSVADAIKLKKVVAAQQKTIASQQRSLRRYHAMQVDSTRTLDAAHAKLALFDKMLAALTDESLTNEERQGAVAMAILGAQSQ